MVEVSRNPGRKRRSRTTGLGARLAVVAVLIVVSLGALTASALVPFVHAFLSARQSLVEVVRFADTLEAASLISAERESANAFMAASPEGVSEALRRLVDARRATTRALASLRLERVVYQDRGCVDAMPHDLVDAAAATLVAARVKVDRVAALPVAARTSAAVKSAIGDMFQAFDAFQDSVVWRTGAMRRCDPVLTGLAMVGHATSDLREYAGRLGSLVVPSLMRGEALTPVDMKQILRVQGRLYELWRLLHGQVGLQSGQVLEATGKDVEMTFFRKGMSFIATVLAENQKDGGHTLTVADVAERYVPTMEPLETLRKVYMADMTTSYTQARDTAWLRLVVISLGASFLLVLMAAIVSWLRLRVLHPLLRARERAVALAEGEAPPFVAEPTRIKEFHRLFDALDILRERLRERDEAMRELRQQADTDGLTGVRNRRALDALALAEATAGAPWSLIVADIDHFKAVNDTYGHQAGDEVLRSLAARLASQLGSDAMLARFGGEEFAILLPGGDLSEAVAMAERLRLAVRSRPVFFSKGNSTLTVRASFGVAKGELGREGWNKLLEAADRALYLAKASGRDCVRVSDTKAGGLASAA